MTIRELFQARPAREAAIAHYGDRFEDFAESQQLYVDVPGIGDEVAKVAFLFRHAREAEIADPDPPVPGARSPTRRIRAQSTSACWMRPTHSDPATRRDSAN